MNACGERDGLAVLPLAEMWTTSPHAKLNPFASDLKNIWLPVKYTLGVDVKEAQSEPPLVLLMAIKQGPGWPQIP